MLTFSYEARDPATGQKVKAEVQAESESAAARLIQEQGLAPLDIKPVGVSSSGALLGKFRNRIKTKEKIVFSLYIFSRRWGLVVGLVLTIGKTRLSKPTS